jgi:hypothetical protein
VGTGLKVIVEILRLNGSHVADVLFTFTHSVSSMHLARESLKGVIGTPAWPPEANGFRIVSEDGAEMYRFPE